MKPFRLLLCGLLLAGTLPAADTLSSPVFSSPVLGYVFDDTAKAIRAIAGVPGAASLGETVSSPEALTEAFVHSAARVAVVKTKDGALALLSWSGGTRLTRMETALGAVKLATFSRSGGRVAVTDGAKVELWSTNGSPALVSWHDRAGITEIAVNDEGVVVAATYLAQHQLVPGFNLDGRSDRQGGRKA